MKHSFSCIIALTGLILCLSSCHTAAPRLDYKALAQASVRLGMDIGLTDNHKLYINAAEWIGTPYRAGGDSKHGTDCSGLVSQLYKKTYRIVSITSWSRPQYLGSSFMVTLSNTGVDSV